MAHELIYAKDEIPEGLEYQYLDAAGDPIDLTGFSATGVLTDEAGTETARAASVSDAANGKATWTWNDGDLDTAGRYRLMMWVNSATTARYASEEITVTVVDRGSYS